MTEWFSRSALFSEVQENLSSQFGIDPEIIRGQSLLIEDLDLDSIDMVDLLSIASERYSVSLSLLDFEGVAHLDDFVSKLEELIRQRSEGEA